LPVLPQHDAVLDALSFPAASWAVIVTEVSAEGALWFATRQSIRTVPPLATVPDTGMSSQGCVPLGSTCGDGQIEVMPS
jgi:hypothetical protein